MSIEIVVPSLGESVVEATIARWLKQEGEPVALGEPLVELETDKVNTELPADDTGVLQQILRREGETVRPGEALGIIAAGAGEPAAGGTQKAAAPPSQARAAAAPAEEPRKPSGTGSEAAVESAPEEVRASPLAQRVAEELHVDLSQVPPSGPGGRVTREDVETYAKGEGGKGKGEKEAAGEPAPSGQGRTAAPPTPERRTPERPAPAGDRRETRERLSRRRLTIARRLVEAQHTAAMLTTFNEVDMSPVMEVRKRRRDQFKEKHGVSLGFMSFFTKAVVGALKAFPQVNAELQDDELVLKHYYDIGIAIGDPEGLVVPVVRDADRLTFAEIEQGIAGFLEKAQNRTLSLDDLRGGTFTITNGGVFGSLLSTPILNPPQVGILGMHKIQERPVVVNGEMVVRPMMYLALSYDHRVVDGREAVQFLVRVKELVEDPERLLLEG
jgi:2-oxoglutarate dehydrogenase E2 component (dihydrolipoamide succinyltransferase)